MEGLNWPASHNEHPVRPTPSYGNAYCPYFIINTLLRERERGEREGGRGRGKGRKDRKERGREEERKEREKEMNTWRAINTFRTCSSV